MKIYRQRLDEPMPVFGLLLVPHGKKWSLLCATSYKGGRVVGNGLIAMGPEGDSLVFHDQLILKNTFSVCRIGDSPGKILAASARGLFVVDNGLQGWEPLCPGLDGVSINGVLPTPDGRIWFFGDDIAGYVDPDGKTQRLGVGPGYGWHEANVLSAVLIPGAVLMGRDIATADIWGLGSLVVFAPKDTREGIQTWGPQNVVVTDKGDLVISLEGKSGSSSSPSYIQSLCARGNYLGITTMNSSSLYQYEGQIDGKNQRWRLVAEGGGGLICTFPPCKEPMLWVGRDYGGIEVLKPKEEMYADAKHWKELAQQLNQELSSYSHIAAFDFAPGLVAVGTEDKGLVVFEIEGQTQLAKQPEIKGGTSPHPTESGQSKTKEILKRLKGIVQAMAGSQKYYYEIDDEMSGGHGHYVMPFDRNLFPLTRDYLNCFYQCENTPELFQYLIESLSAESDMATFLAVQFLEEFLWDREPVVTVETIIKNPWLDCIMKLRGYKPKSTNDYKQALERNLSNWDPKNERKSSLKSFEEIICDIDQNGMSALHHTARNGNYTLCNSIIENGADVNLKDNFGSTALHMATKAHNKDVCDLLISKDAEVNAKDNDGFSPLHIAAMAGHSEFCGLLLKYGAEVNLIDGKGSSPLHIAAQHGNSGVCEILFKYGANPNSINNENMSPLHIAAQNGNNEVCMILLKYGANAKAINKEKKTPLNIARENGHLHTFDVLYVGSDVEKFHEYVKFEKINALKKIISDNPSLLNERDRDGKTALFFAVENKQKDAVEFLLANGADANIKDIYNAYPLHYAASLGNVEIVISLAEKVNNINERDKNNWTALKYAVINCLDEIAIILRQHGGVE